MTGVRSRVTQPRRSNVRSCCRASIVLMLSASGMTMGVCISCISSHWASARQTRNIAKAPEPRVGSVTCRCRTDYPMQRGRRADRESFPERTVTYVLVASASFFLARANRLIIVPTGTAKVSAASL